MVVFKIICLVIFTLCAIACFGVGLFATEKRYPNEKQRLKIIVRFRMICFLGMMVLLFLCVIF